VITEAHKYNIFLTKYRENLKTCALLDNHSGVAEFSVLLVMYSHVGDRFFHIT